ncbi:MAG: 4Fe-4S binding protein, partial [Lentisphaerae bacterium]|nr:4Fe-4S binding protein [Lentisphaerota bacterium]
MRLAVRILILAAAVLAGTGLFSDRVIVLVPALSPFLAAGGAAARRAAGPLLFLALPLLAAAAWRGRWFCRNACPMGLLSELAGRAGRRDRARFRHWPRLGPWLLVLALGGAAAGYPLLLGLDPLSVFQGGLSAFRRPWLWVNLLPAAGLAAVLLLSVWRPNAWCLRLCPLGALQDLVRRGTRSLYGDSGSR